ncbi:enoyl-CoA hydratase/isomerase family protein [Jatrophihabitans sp.]|uniref:enoyl-CoA hydratase/isomerase family protein n=1 Tax=Jatrophihabitans sp. TaxID=1932789 RepID=UPI002C1A5F95|nr:enoyl-CoA hydratase-related protein [Jatrophihabitans sp.]
MTEFVALEVADGVATLRIDRPPVNALNTAVQDELRAAAAECERRDDIRAVILWGGEKVFVAGADVKEMHTMSAQDMQRRAGAVSDSLDAIARLPKPVIAAVTGYALGGGCELALTADFRVSADDAKWGQPEVLLGVIPGMGGTQRLARLIGPARAKDLIFTGRFVDAQEAHQLGLVDVVVPADEVYRTAQAMAAKFARGPALALRAAKTAIDVGLQTDLASGLRLESQLFAAVFATEDKQRGMASFIESGPGKAEFTGN